MRGPIAIKAWHAWKRQVDLETIDLGSRRLIPLLFDNLSEFGIHDPILAKYQGIKKLYWYHNCLLLHDLESIIGAFTAAKIPVMPVKGCALNLLGYFKSGQRPMGDLDIVVPQARAFEAAAILESLGWQRDTTQNRPLAPAEVRFSAHSKFTKDRVLIVELHWESPTQFLRGPGLDDTWHRSVPAEFHGISCRVLDPTSQLLHIVAHGASANAIAPIRWASDAFVLVQSGSINWPDFVKQAKQQRLVPFIRDQLHFLTEKLSFPIPAKTLSALDEVKVGIVERALVRAEILPESQIGFFSALARHIVSLRRLSGGCPAPLFALAYLKHNLLLSRNDSLFRGLAKSIMRRIKISLS